MRERQEGRLKKTLFPFLVSQSTQHFPYLVEERRTFLTAPRATFREPSASAVRKAADGGKTAG
jgi:hypothetical protein